MIFDEMTKISEFLAYWLDHSLLETSEQAILNAYYRNYKSTFSNRIREHYDQQLHELMELMNAGKVRRVLEIGCGCGTESLWIAMQGAEIDAIDINEERLQVAKSRQVVVEHNLGRKLACRFLQTSVLDLEPENPYDVIWMEQAFHHLEPRVTVMDRLVTLLRPNGYLIISEVNGLNPLLQLQLFFRRGIQTIKTFESGDGRIHLYGNERIVSGPRLKKDLEKRGLACKCLQYFRVFPHHDFFNKLRWLEHKMPSWVRIAFTHYTYVGQKE